MVHNLPWNSFVECGFDAKGIKALASVLEKSRIQNLELSGNFLIQHKWYLLGNLIGDEAAIYLSYALEKNKHLKRLGTAGTEVSKLIIVKPTK